VWFLLLLRFLRNRHLSSLRLLFSYKLYEYTSRHVCLNSRGNVSSLKP
jgi:hypothetical protein